MLRTTRFSRRVSHSARSASGPVTRPRPVEMTANSSTYPVRSIGDPSFQVCSITLSLRLIVSTLISGLPSYCRVYPHDPDPPPRSTDRCPRLDPDAQPSSGGATPAAHCFHAHIGSP